jgi:hypothetical protein
MTPSGIEPATFRFVAQCLNQPRYRVPYCEGILFGYWGKVIRTNVLLLPIVVVVRHLVPNHTGCGMQTDYTVKPRCCATVCSLQFVTLHRGLNICSIYYCAGPGWPAVLGVGLRPLDC